MPKFRNKYRIKSTRLVDWDYTTAWWYYVTICTKNHECFFGEIKKRDVVLSEIGKIIKEEWLKTKLVRENIELDEFVIMPNHIHGIIIIDDVETTGSVISKEKKEAFQQETTQRVVFTKLQKNSLGSIIGQFKSVCTKRIRRMGIKDFQWQSNYYDHIIRNQKDLDRIRKYIQQNPLRWELDEYYKL